MMIEGLLSGIDWRTKLKPFVEEIRVAIGCCLIPIVYNGFFLYERFWVWRVDSRQAVKGRLEKSQANNHQPIFINFDL